ncbi:hypothetical protein EWH08_04605 [Sphingobium indicum]|uniref:Uncharacterized protein n=2 Tax=Sphingobium indicum TaxID=332055 RepID=A0A1L5BM52_SPHIB|nr:hypothetical protein [Sphingobium indicum]APL93985.1 hypothetical protein SIDU_05395 [Sphingobium indicum B90A]KEY98403.1 hypothetical protein AI27_12025 [Sphingomonas sp. BHC-A]NYI21436.1 hypothetical protein [Sphingobium indicum]RYM03775.1 hypothetical protein EWH08_04605 [Sphingobium indicum]
MKRLLFLLAFLPSGALAAPDPCASAPPLAEPWTSWTQSGSVMAGATLSSAPRIILGKPVTATLRPAPQVQFVVPPGRSVPKSHAGLFTLAVKDAARIGIALSAAAWVDAATGATALASAAHEHGPRCSGIRKIVWFDLPPGLHAIQVAGAINPSIRIMAADARANQPLPR